jgi:hypothetical protein
MQRRGLGSSNLEVSLGQTLIVTAGSGWVQQWGGPVQVHPAR